MSTIKLPPRPESVDGAIERYADSVHDFNFSLRIDVGSDRAGTVCLEAEKAMYETLRARDLEVARCVLEGAAQRLETQAANIDRLVSRDSWDASASSVRQGACYVRALEIKHD